VDALAAKIVAGGGQALAVTCDVSDPVAVKDAVAAALARFGRIDHLINNAGVIDPIGRFLDTDPAAWVRLMEINLNGAMYACHAAMPELLRRKGVIVNISSGAGHRPVEGWTAYCTSKAALVMLTRGLDLEYGAEGLRVYGFAPGTVLTDMQRNIRATGIGPVAKLPIEALQPAELPARMVAWLCTAEAADFPVGECAIRDEELRRRSGVEVVFPV
jgi:NAD(P)-dependent dehydrogenase (short-subunit alcohol dehydrogenase family)